MGRKKVVTTEVSEGEDEEISLPAGNSDGEMVSEAELDAMDELRALGGGDAISYSVTKLVTKPGERGGYCARYSAGDLSMDAIRESFGGGKYRIRGMNENGKWVPGASMTIEVMDLPKPLNGAAVANPSSITPELIAALKPGDNGVAALMPLLLKMMESSAQQMTALMTAIAGKKDDTKLTDILALINATKPEKEKDSVQTLLEGIKLGQSFAGGGGDGSSWLDIAGKGLDALKPMIAAQAANLPHTPAVPGPAPAALPAPNPQPTIAAAPPAPTAGADPMLQQLNWLRVQTNALCMQAARHAAGKGGDPELYADILLDNLPPFLTPDALYARISAPDAIDQLAALDARVAQYRPWFEQFRQAVLDTFAPDEGDNEGEPGDEGESA